MAVSPLLGYLFLTAGPPLVIWCLCIARKSFLVLLAVASAFYWLLTLFLVSLFFKVFLPLPRQAAIYGAALFTAVAVQEVARYGAYHIHRAIITQLREASRQLSLAKLTRADCTLMALTQGLGHGIAQSTFLYFSWLQMAAGRGTLYLDACPQMSYFLAAGLLSLAFFFLHTFSMIVAFHGYDKDKKGLVGAVAGLHLVAALTMLVNLVQGGCVVGTFLAIMEGITAIVVAAVICWVESGQDWQMLEETETVEEALAA